MQSVVVLWLKAIFRLIELLPTHSVMVAEGILQEQQPGSVKASEPVKGDQGKEVGPEPKRGTSGGGGGGGGDGEEAGSSGTSDKGKATPKEQKVSSVEGGGAEEHGVVQGGSTGPRPLLGATLWSNLALGCAGVAVVVALVWLVGMGSRSPTGGEVR